jgi:hypothetical protein
VFVLLTVRVLLALRADFLPPQHLDVSRSGFRALGDGRARLTLVLLHAAGPDAVATRTEAPVPGVSPLIVAIETRGGVPAESGVGGEVTLELDLPAVDRVRVLDLRWEHPREHPQGHEFELEPGADGP